MLEINTAISSVNQNYKWQSSSVPKSKLLQQPHTDVYFGSRPKLPTNVLTDLKIAMKQKLSGVFVNVGKKAVIEKTLIDGNVVKKVNAYKHRKSVYRYNTKHKLVGVRKRDTLGNLEIKKFKRSGRPSYGINKYNKDKTYEVIFPNKNGKPE